MFLLMSMAWSNPITTIEGPRPPRDLKAASTGRLEAFSRCFNGTTVGEVKFRIKVEPDGLVSDAQYSTTVSDQALLQCLVSESMRMRMPKRAPSEGTTMFQWIVSMDSLNAPIPPEFKPGEFHVTGTTEKEEIEAIVKSQEKQFRYCYERELPREPQLAGTFDLKLTLDAYGTVSMAEAKNVNFSNTRVIDCAKGRFERLQFPAPAEGQVIQIYYPFGFSPPEVPPAGEAPKP